MHRDQRPVGKMRPSLTWIHSPHGGECPRRAYIHCCALENRFRNRPSSSANVILFLSAQPSICNNLTKTARMKTGMFVFEEVGRQPQTQRAKTNSAFVFLSVAPGPPHALHRQGLRADSHRSAACRTRRALSGEADA